MSSRNTKNLAFEKFKKDSTGGEERVNSKRGKDPIAKKRGHREGQTNSAQRRGRWGTCLTKNFRRVVKEDKVSSTGGHPEMWASMEIWGRGAICKTKGNEFENLGKGGDARDGKLVTSSSRMGLLQGNGGSGNFERGKNKLLSN